MNNYELICAKLEAFIRKYYTNELIKGTILFFSVGLLYLLLLVSLEYFFWLGQIGRSILFWSFIVVEVGLFVKFIIIPLFRLFKLSKGIDLETASTMIGNHFPEVSDKLLNVLQLKKQGGNSELVMAGIDQKAAELKPVPFQFAINFKGNLKYVKFAIIPVLVILAIYISGKSELFSNSYERIVHYQVAYEPPAPFQFFVLNDSLNSRQNESFALRIRSEGSVVPDNASIHFNGETYFLKSEAPGDFTYVFDKMSQPIDFYVSANQVRSKNYHIDVVPVPTLLDFEMELDYPAYTGKSDEKINGTGNATVPAGTRVFWKLKTRATDRVTLQTRDSLLNFQQNGSDFSLEKRILESISYQLATSNKNITDYEKLSFNLKATKDDFPKMELQMKVDSIDKQSLYFHGKVSDDYGLSKMELVFYPINNPTEINKRPISIPTTSFAEFLYAFPDTLQLEKGVSYEFYFQVFDNDGVFGAKKTKSRVFNFRKPTDSEKEKQLLENQKVTMQEMNKSAEKLEDFKKELSEFNQLEKEQNQWSYTDRKKLENFLERQEKQRQMMMNYTKDLQRNLEEFQPEEEKDPYKQELQERLAQTEKELKENEELLKKLEEYTKKINEENLGKELEQLAKENINQQKNLEQLLELTKRFYVEEKTKKIAEDLQRLAKEQDALSKKKEENTKEAQDSLNEKFQEIEKEMNELEKENETLKNPMELGLDEKKKESISQEQKEASEKLEQAEEARQGEQQKQQQKSKAGAEKNQQNAAKKMQELSDKMQQQMMMAAAQGAQEDAEMLRQILDNLLTFSFQQEALMEDFKTIQEKNPIYVEKLKRQNMLRTNFEHVDDSLYALALRNPMVSIKITEKLTDVAFNIDKSIERLSENQLPQGIGSQQYTITGANDLALMLGSALNQMQMQMKGMGQGKPGNEGEGRGFQLPDIIKKQGEIGEKMKQGMQQGQSGEGKEGKSGENGKPKAGKSGQQKSGEGGQSQGKQGKGQEGLNGELYEIYKQQQQLRNALEEKIREAGLGPDAKRMVREMEEISNELLLKGFNQQTLEKILALQHQLMKLENATYKQGQESKRESETNKKEYRNTTNANLLKAKDYFQTTEILNRQRLPLRQNYKELVEEYFNKL